MSRLLFVLLLVVSFLSGCAVNPVTGKRELTFVSEAQELAIGEKNYAPSRQMQGGDLVVDPALTDYVKEVGQRLAAASDRKLPYEFTVLNNSVPNAWAMPGGKIAVNRGLLVEFNSEAELAAVLGHEIVHAAARHGAKGMERGMLLQGAILATGIAVRDKDYGTLALGGAQLAASLTSQKYGRDAERQSDLYGIKYMKRAGYDPQAAVTLQETFVRLSAGRKQNWLSGLFASHPPSQERVENNRAEVARIGAGGEIGKQRYLEKTAYLRKTKAAYGAHDKGRKALAEKDTQTAMRLAKKAIATEAREGQFYALLGDVQYTQSRFQDALNNYDRAVKYNPNFFHFFVQRGLTRKQLGNFQGARADLEKSTKLLPTATAFNGLGDLAMQNNDRQQAVKYYQAAAGSKSEPGRRAAHNLVRLDLPQNPNRYLKIRTAADRNGYLVAEVANQTPAAIGDIELVAQYPDGSGRMRQDAQRIRGIIPAGQSIRVQTRFGPVHKKATSRQIQIAVRRAAVAE